MNKYITRGLGGLTIAALMVGAFAVTTPSVNAGGDPDPSAICNMSTNILQFDATFPDGTIKAGVSPQFEIGVANTCSQSFNGRFVTVTTPNVYDAEGTLVPIGPATTQISKDVLFKSNTYKLYKNKLSSIGVNQVVQMRSVISLYHSSSFEANGSLKPGATPMASDMVGWTQTNFRTF